MKNRLNVRPGAFLKDAEPRFFVGIARAAQSKQFAVT
jgi:hypothetical protein